MSIKKQILDATLQLLRSDDHTDLNIQHLSDFSGISIPDIESNFETLEEIINALFEFRTNDHFEKSEEILKNTDPLQNLLHHDLDITYRIKFFTEKYSSESTIGKLGRESTENSKAKMSKCYEQLLNSKTYLLPEDVQEPALYAKFITHSLFFLTKENLDQIL